MEAGYVKVKYVHCTYYEVNSDMYYGGHSITTWTKRGGRAQ